MKNATRRTWTWTLAASVIAAAGAGCGPGGMFGGFNFSADPAPPAPPAPPDSGPPVEPPIGDDQPAPPNAVHPDFGPTVVQDVAPPPISGGTLLVSKDGATAYAADPDRDAVYVVDLAKQSVATIALQPHDEPGRVAIDAAGRLHVVLRGAGAIADLDPVAHAVIARRTACPMTRGIAYDPGGDRLFVACADGSLVTFPAAGGAATRTVKLQPDLRDVVVVGSRLFASFFRSAQVVEIVSDGTIANTFASPQLGATPGVLWRLTARPDGTGLVASMQAALESAIPPGQGSYGSGGCGGAVTQPAIVEWSLDGQVTLMQILMAASLPVDVSVDGTRNGIYVAFAGESKIPGATQLAFIPDSSLPPDAGPPPPPSCGDGLFGPSDGSQPIAIGFAGDKLVVQSREPAQLRVDDVVAGSSIVIPLSSVSRADTGHDVFHSDQGGGVSCASCHAEGGEDGRTWLFGDVGSRRTPSLLGTVQGTAPYHWQGEEPDLPTLYSGALQRMNGVDLASDQVAATTRWIDGLAAPPPQVTDAAAIARGKALFAGTGQCATCHSGAKFTNNQSMDVGQGTAFQVPPLVGVAWRAPYMHTGCAYSLVDTFSSSGTCGLLFPQHGAASSFTTAQAADLAAYLGSL